MIAFCPTCDGRRKVKRVSDGYRCVVCGNTMYAGSVKK